MSARPSETLSATGPPKRKTSCSTTASRRRCPAPQRDALHRVTAPLAVVEAVEEFDERRLSRARRADDRDPLPGRDPERYVAEDPGGLRAVPPDAGRPGIREPDVVEDDL